MKLLTPFAVDAGELCRTSALVSVNEVDAGPAVLAWVRHTLVNLCTANTRHISSIKGRILL